MEYIGKQLKAKELTSDSYEKAVLAVRFERGTRQQMESDPEAAKAASLRGQEAAL
jgi:hypothetical protein